MGIYRFNNNLKGGFKMEGVSKEEEFYFFKGSKINYKWFKDEQGNEYLCIGNCIADPEGITRKDLKTCCFSDTEISVNVRQS